MKACCLEAAASAILYFEFLVLECGNATLKIAKQSVACCIYEVLCGLNTFSIQSIIINDITIVVLLPTWTGIAEKYKFGPFHIEQSIICPAVLLHFLIFLAWIA